MSTVRIALSEETREVVITNNQQEAERLKHEGWTPSYEPFMFGNDLAVWLFYKPIPHKEESKFDRITSIKEIYDTFAANQHLSAGWKLLSVSTSAAGLLYIVGLEEGTELLPYNSGDSKSDALAALIKKKSTELDAEEASRSQKNSKLV